MLRGRYDLCYTAKLKSQIQTRINLGYSMFPLSKPTPLHTATVHLIFQRWTKWFNNSFMLSIRTNQSRIPAKYSKLQFSGKETQIRRLPIIWIVLNPYGANYLTCITFILCIFIISWRRHRYWRQTSINAQKGEQVHYQLETVVAMVWVRRSATTIKHYFGYITVENPEVTSLSDKTNTIDIMF